MVHPSLVCVGLLLEVPSNRGDAGLTTPRTPTRRLNHDYPYGVLSASFGSVP
jgi:hypothetical protein